MRGILELFVWSNEMTGIAMKSIGTKTIEIRISRLKDSSRMCFIFLGLALIFHRQIKVDLSPQAVAIAMEHQEQLDQLGWKFKEVQGKIYLCAVPCLRDVIFSVNGILLLFAYGSIHTK